MVLELNDVLMGLCGGLLIGVSAALFLLANGRIAGISGLLGGLISRTGAGRFENLAFICGIVISPLVLSLVIGAPEIGVTGPVWLFVAAGVLVGLGTRMGSGCTSGHGVCGLSRLSIRSLTATLAFLAVGVATASLLRPVLAGFVGGS